MKLQSLKKRFAIESGAIIAIGVVVGGILYFLSSVSEDYHTENTAAQGKVNNIMGEINALKGKYNNIQSNSVLYAEVEKRKAENSLAIGRQIAEDKFNIFNNHYALNNLRLSMAPLQSLTDAKYKRKTHIVQVSEITATFDVISDEFVYGMIGAIQKDMPGISKITRLNMIRQGMLTNDILRSISQKGTHPLVKTDVRFLWMGIVPVESVETETIKKKK